MSSAPRVSVVVPAYNQADYLAIALNSILDQSYPDYEILVVDDGSTDETATVARSFSDSIRYIWQENQGLAGARNTGIRQAQGEFVALLDSDDCWHPEFLETMMALSAAQPDGSVYYAGWRYMDTQGRELPQAPGQKVIPPAQMYSALLKSNFINCCTVVMRRAAVMTSGLFDPAFRRLQDRELWVRMLRQGHTFIGTAACLVRYRIHDSSLSTDPTGGIRAVLALAAKHFGPDEGHPADWSTEKRQAYSGAYRSCAITALVRQHNWQSCAHYVRLALQIDPTLAVDLAFFYELALGAQPLGYRGTPYKTELTADCEQIEHFLHQLLQPGTAQVLPLLYHQCRGTAFYALGLSAAHRGDFALSRVALGKALFSRPELGRAFSFWRTWSKVWLGYPGYQRLRALRKSLAGI